jgi:hypothetical protein
MRKQVIIPIVLGVVLVLVLGGAAWAQQATPTPGQGFGMPTLPGMFGGQGWLGGGKIDWKGFDSVANALGMTPTELFEALHGGKTLADIAKEKNVDLAKVQGAAQTARLDAMKQRIQHAVTAGKLTQAQADAMLKALENGRFPGVPGMGGMRGLGTPGLRGGLGSYLRGWMGGFFHGWMGPGFRGRPAPGSGGGSTPQPGTGTSSGLTPSFGGVTYWE